MESYYWLIIITVCGLIAGVLIWWLKAIKNTEEIEYDFSDGRGYYPEDYLALQSDYKNLETKYNVRKSEADKLIKRVFILENEKNNVIAARDALFRTVKQRDETIKDLKSDLQDAIAQRNKAEDLLKAFNSTYDSQKEKMDELNRKLANDYTNNNGRLDKRMETAAERRAENSP